jgi:hypothetical protein
MIKRLREWVGTLADAATLVSIGIGFVAAAVVGAYLSLSKAGLGWSIVASAGALLILGGGLRFGWTWLEGRIDRVGEEAYLREKRIRITDLVTPDDPVVKARTLERCRLIGPAVIAFTGAGVLSGGRFDGDVASTFIEVPDGSRVIGVIGFHDCVLRDCRFHNIAIIGTPQQIAQYKKGFGGLP